VKTLIRRLMPRGIRPHRIAAGPLQGMWLVSSWHDYPAGITGRTERPLVDWFSAHVNAGETWLDVGAHYGYTAFALARLVGPEGRVFAFEPVVATAGCADQGRILNRLHQLTVVPVGLGVPPTVETRQLPMTRGMADSTPRQETADGGATIVMIARFDWLWPLISRAELTIHGIKIDVQGMEIETLEGMRDTLMQMHPRLVIELHEGVNRERLLALLGDLGYSTDAVPLEPVRGEDKPLFVDNRSYLFTPA
jgi:FkbM family methyltransferase